MDNPGQAAILQGMTVKTDILIVGGGLNGPCLAIALASAGISSVVIDALPSEARDADTFDGRSYALALASVRMLRALGLWEGLSDNAQPMLEIKASDGRAGEGPAPFFLHFDHAEIEEGPMGHMLEDRYLRRAFLDVSELSDGDTGDRRSADRAAAGRRRWPTFGRGGARRDQASRVGLRADRAGLFIGA